MGTPEFAIPSLKKLNESSHKIVGIVTQPDRPKGRGRRISESPVKREALNAEIPIMQPEFLKDTIFLQKLEEWNGDCFIVVGFRILPPVVYEMPQKGTINLHASLLPKYRGAAPIQWALINGEVKTGVTTFFITKQVDTGDIILQKDVLIREDEIAGELHDRLSIAGADLLVKTVDLIDSDKVKTIPQRGKHSPAPKIKSEHCEIDWNQSAENIVNLIRAFSPSPGAFTFLKGKRLKLFKVIKYNCTNSDQQPGTILGSSNDGLVVQTGHGQVLIMAIQIEGKQKMAISEFLHGHTVLNGTNFNHSEN
jgi:methionyl-tRNA formyltransferase